MNRNRRDNSVKTGSDRRWLSEGITRVEVRLRMRRQRRQRKDSKTARQKDSKRQRQDEDGEASLLFSWSFLLLFS